MSVISKSFTAAGNSDQVYVKNGEAIYYEYSGTYSAVFQLEYSKNSGQSFEVIVSNSTDNASSSGVYYVDQKDVKGVNIRFRCLSRASGTVVTKLVSVYKNKILTPAQHHTKVGATAGWVTGGTTDVALVTCPASQTASTAVFSLPASKQGDVIKAFHLVGQIESAGGAVTLDCALRKGTAAAADVADSLIASMTQISVTADTVIDFKNSTVDGLHEVINENCNYYLLLTATTAAATDIALQGMALVIEKGE